MVVGIKKLDLLLVEDDLEDQELIRGALAEIEESGPRYNWFTSEVVAVDHLADALHCLNRARFDAVLLDLALPDSPLLLNTLTQVHTAAPETALIVLIDSDDDALACRLLREGVQDVLVKNEVDCALLARTLRHAVERQRRSRALRAISFFDDLTGFYSRYGFVTLAGHDLAAAKATGAPITMAILDVEGCDRELENRDLLILDIAEKLQNAFLDATLLGRLDATSFGLVAFISAEQQFQTCLERFRRDLQTLQGGLRVLGGTVSLPQTGPYDLEQLLRNAIHKVAPGTAMLAI